MDHFNVFCYWIWANQLPLPGFPINNLFHVKNYIFLGNSLQAENFYLLYLTVPGIIATIAALLPTALCCGSQKMIPWPFLDFFSFFSAKKARELVLDNLPCRPKAIFKLFHK